MDVLWAAATLFCLLFRLVLGLSLLEIVSRTYRQNQLCACAASRKNGCFGEAPSADRLSPSAAEALWRRLLPTSGMAPLAASVL